MKLQSREKKTSVVTSLETVITAVLFYCRIADSHMDNTRGKRDSNGFNQAQNHDHALKNAHSYLLA